MLSYIILIYLVSFYLTLNGSFQIVYYNVSKPSKHSKLAFDTERNSIVESKSLISVLNENSELPSMPTTSSDADNVSLTTPNVMTYGQIPSLSPAPRSSLPVQTI